ncbi:MAG: hypothetical protein H8E55_12970, partial [Pelagibacterales bacterium]|nr:hypothetical protein [Pelagibacterales bacterium]
MHIRYKNKRYTVRVTRKGFKTQYKTFDKKSDAQRFGKQVEAQIQLSQFKDLSKASKTTFLDVMQRHLEDRRKEVKEPKKEQTRFNTCVKATFINKFMADLMPSDFASYRDKRLEEGAAAATVVRELSFMPVAITKVIEFYDCWIPDHPIKKS